MPERVEHLVIGGGPAGSMLALRLASSGREVLLLEKEYEPHHKVCGEFLSQEAVGYLEQIGLKPLDLGAKSIHCVRMYSGRHVAESCLPFRALSLSRHVLDEILLQRAASAGCKIHRGAFVEKLHRHRGTWTAQVRGSQSIDARAVFLATGKHDLSDWPRSPGSQPDLVGFKMHWRLGGSQTECLRDIMELFLFRDGYGGLSLVENEVANLCFVVRRRRLRELGGWTGLLDSIRHEVPTIDQRLRSAIACWTKPLAISPIPYGHLASPASDWWRIGDQAAVIPSFTGDGMSIALHSAELAAKVYLAGESPEVYSRRLEDQLRPGMRFALTLSQSIITSAGRTIAPLAFGLVPGAMGWIAKKTRIPDRALPDPGNPSGAIHSSPASLA